MRRQGAGADRRPRQGRRHQGRQERRRGARARDGDPRHGHPRPHGPRGLDRGAPARSPPSTTRRSSSTARRRRRCVHVLHEGRHGHRGGRRGGPGRDRHAARRPAARLPGLPRAGGWPSRAASTPTSCARSAPSSPSSTTRSSAEEAMLVEVNPMIVHDRSVRRRARREGHARRQRALPPPGERRAARPERRGPAGADGPRARADLRQARRRHRHPRQRRRARDEHARRRRPVRRRARELPRRRRRLEGRGDHAARSR